MVCLSSTLDGNYSQMQQRVGDKPYRLVKDRKIPLNRNWISRDPDVKAWSDSEVERIDQTVVQNISKKFQAMKSSPISPFVVSQVPRSHSCLTCQTAFSSSLNKHLNSQMHKGNLTANLHIYKLIDAEIEALQAK